MKYELGDLVKIKAHYKRQNLSKQMQQEGIGQDIESYLFSDDMAGDYYRFIKYKREELDERGYVCGTRTIKIEADLSAQHEDETYWGSARVYQEDFKMKKFYLIATNMNTIRYVDFNDIQYIYEENAK